jgi:hypothetical protein
MARSESNDKETIDPQEYLAAPELKDAFDALKVNNNWTKLLDLAHNHWCSALRRCAKDVLDAALIIDEADHAAECQREEHERRIECGEKKS